MPATFAASAAPCAATGISPDGHDDIFVIQQNPAVPARQAHYQLHARAQSANPNDLSIAHASNRNPAWSTTRVDTDPATGQPRIGGIPPGQDANGNPTGQGQILLGLRQYACGYQQ